MDAQKPAEGIMLHKAWGETKAYTVTCNCGEPDHIHSVWVEADECGVTVTTYTTQETDWWSNAVEPRYDIENDLLQRCNWFWTALYNGLITRLRLTKEIWIRGFVKYESTIIMSQQQALNYAETLKSAVADVEEIRKNNVRN